MKTPIYLDSAATTPPLKEVIDHLSTINATQWGNPSSAHQRGKDAKIVLEQARRDVAYLLGATTSEIFFTSCGTESNNTVLLQARAAGIRRIISTRIEHHSITHTLDRIESENSLCFPENQIEIIYLGINPDGSVNLNELEDILSESNVKTLVSIMHANNEIGTMYPLKKIGNLAHRYGALFHTDAVQTVGHYKIDLSELPVDFLSASAHKFHGTKGVGILFVRAGINYPSLILGGEQERGMRSGTENVAQISAMALALSIAHRDMETDQKHILRLKELAVAKLSVVDGIRFNGRCADTDHSLFHIINITLPIQKDSAMLLFALDIEGVQVSAGSACMSGAWQQSQVISRLYNDDDSMKNCPTIRISFSKFNTEEELGLAVDKILEKTLHLYKYSEK